MYEITTLRVDCRGREAVVEVFGTGPDVVMVGAASPMALVRPAAGVLAQQGFKVTNLDYGSGHPSPEPRSALDQVGDVVTVMDAVGIVSALIVGISRGAITAYGLASLHPGRARGLVLTVPVSGFRDSLRAAPRDDEDLVEAPPEMTIEQILGAVFSAEFLATHLHEAVDLVDTPEGSVTRLERSDEAPFPHGMSVDCPTLIIEGEADSIVSGEHPARYVEAIPGARHVSIPRAPHGWPMEAPGAFAEMVAEFSRSLD
ncbi:MAG: alpha/beta hydrolase [Acidimicrobiia bacterium]